MTADADDADDRTRTHGGRRTVLSLSLALVAVTAALGAVLGYALPTQSGVTEMTLLGMSIPVSPITLALYGAVSVGTFLVAALLAVSVVSRFDENAV